MEIQLCLVYSLMLHKNILPTLVLVMDRRLPVALGFT